MKKFKWALFACAIMGGFTTAIINETYAANKLVPLRYHLEANGSYTLINGRLNVDYACVLDPTAICTYSYDTDLHQYVPSQYGKFYWIE
ncbi:hypothetical protein LX64_00415 [Chitinophaga skermanii]|uniref:Uncharacterized protein n=1 Tax=Chitinophaga skermanii TaxID=331697 RepID=A0A327R437_9BACT|nr:hypothetical protein [Chitinophaga skermanii]RAJ10808.1 hypothetical protein LX64_00415 [Chitinophaga skermanii]